MRIADRRVGVLWAWLLVVASAASAQVRVDAGTRLKQVEIRFEGAHHATSRELQAVLVQRGPGVGEALQTSFAWLPFIRRPETQAFRPIELQRDVVRLREHLRAAGYPRADVRYTVALDERRNVVRIRLIVAEGAPDVVRSVEFAAADSGVTLRPPARKQLSWGRFVHQARGAVGHPVSPALRDGRARDTETWWRDRGHPAAAATAEVVLDTLRHDAQLIVRVRPDAAATIGAIRVEGAERVTEGTIVRSLQLREGDAYSARLLIESQRTVQSLPVVRFARIETEGKGDSTIDLRVQITEAPAKVISGELGYVSDAGVSSEVRWSHHNLDHRALSFTISGIAQTGLFSLADIPEKRYRASVTLQKPAFPVPRMSLLVSPFIEDHDDTRDRSLTTGLDLTAVEQFAPLRTVAASYQFANKHVYQRRLDDFASGNTDLLQLFQEQAQGLLDSLGGTLRSSVLTITSTVGDLDDPASPKRGLVLRPALSVTAPPSGNTTEYVRADATLQGYLPLSRRVTLSARFVAGKVFPFGSSLPGSERERQAKFLQLRDVMFTGGGTGDVRGYANDLLGPKFPDARLETVGDSLVIRANGYVPIGGLARSSASLELQLPLPGVGSTWGAFVFLDAGRVWTGDTRFQHDFDRVEQERWFYATGGGLELRTPVGPIRAGVGYKLDPSIEDLASASDVLDAALAGRSFDTLPKRNARHWQFHLAVGTSY